MEEKNYYKISKLFDDMNEIELKFSLWYLLQSFIRQTESELKEYRDCNTKEELAAQIMMHDEVKYAKQIRETIGYDLW